VYDAVCVTRAAVIVRHYDGGSVALLHLGLDQLHDLFAELGVERAGGFVEEHERRLVYERASDGNALALAAGELGGEVCGAVGEGQLGEQMMDGVGAVLALVLVAWGAGLGAYQVVRGTVLGRYGTVTKGVGRLLATVALVGLVTCSVYSTRG